MVYIVIANAPQANVSIPTNAFHVEHALDFVLQEGWNEIIILFSLSFLSGMEKFTCPLMIANCNQYCLIGR